MMNCTRIFALLCMALTACTSMADTFHHARWLPLTEIEAAAAVDSGKLHDWMPWFTPYNTLRPMVPQRREVLADRDVYMADDAAGQFIVSFIGADHGRPDAKLVVEVVAGGKVVATHAFSPIPQPKLAFLLNTRELAAGEYELRARLENVPHAPVIESCGFSKSAEARRAMAFPADGVKLKIHEQSHIPDAQWPISTGFPLPRGVGDSVDSFVLTENGKPVAAQFHKRASWQPDGSQIKWMALDFTAKYDAGTPREYRVFHRPAGGPGAVAAAQVNITATDDAYVVDTGAIRFTVGRKKFAGVENVLLAGSDVPLVAASGGAGGPFLMDERMFTYLASRDAAVSVTLEEAGPVRATIAATGWYTSDRNEKACMFQTRMTVWAGKPWIDVNHATIITFDTDRKRLRELGFNIPTAGGATWRFGGDGKTHEGAIPDKQTVWFHQDRYDHFRVAQGADSIIAEGARTDGWAQLVTPQGSITLAARNLWQLFPKEIELGANTMTFHQWPRHGHVAFTEFEELDGLSIHKLRYAHQGQYLDLRFPQRYFDAFPKVIEQIKPPTVAGRFYEQQDINALTGNGRGLAISTDFLLTFENPAAAQPEKLAALYQQQPHAIPNPVYSGLTEVEGRFAGHQPDKFPELERLLTEGYRGFTMSVDYLDNYGMWIWPDTHNNWNYLDKSVQGHRWWLNAHYQGVWEALFLYWRTGDESIWQFSRDNSRHFMDVGTVNYHDPAERMQGKITGANYHTKGFTPWGSPRYGERTSDDYVEVGAHFVNPDAHVLRYLLLGDHRALNLARAWGKAFEHVALPPERSREACTVLGEMISYYELTWDPMAIVHMRDLARDMLSRPMKEIPAHPGHTMYHDRWVMRYWNRTRDEMLKSRILDWFTPDGSGRSYPQLRALCYEWTGDKAWLTAVLPGYANIWRMIYDNPADPLHCWGGRGFYFPTHSTGQMAPYFMAAAVDAGLREVPWDPDATGSPIAAVVTPAKDAKPGSWFNAPKGVSAWADLYAYVQPREATGKITFEAQSYIRTGNSPALGYLCVFDADGQKLEEFQVLPQSQKPTHTFTLDPTKQKLPYRFYLSGTMLLKWTGDAAGLTLAPTAAEAVK